MSGQRLLKKENTWKTRGDVEISQLRLAPCAGLSSEKDKHHRIPGLFGWEGT